MSHYSIVLRFYHLNYVIRRRVHTSDESLLVRDDVIKCLLPAGCSHYKHVKFVFAKGTSSGLLDCLLWNRLPCLSPQHGPKAMPPSHKSGVKRKGAVLKLGPRPVTCPDLPRPSPVHPELLTCDLPAHRVHTDLPRPYTLIGLGWAILGSWKPYGARSARS